VLLSLIALGIDRERARDLVQATWARLYEQHKDGKLAALELPGLAIRQARFLAIDSFRHTDLQRRTLALALATAPPPHDGEHQLLTRDQLRRALDALAACSPTAQQLFRLLYTPPPMTCADAAREIGLSAERARHVVCEARKLLRQAIGEDR
jgi:RNA polymerase sigma-70 factor (ECF subfamily)